MRQDRQKEWTIYPKLICVDWQRLPVPIQYTDSRTGDGFVLPLARVTHNWMPVKSWQAAYIDFAGIRVTK